MSPIRSLGNKIASFRNKFGNTGFNAATPPPGPPQTEASGGTKINYNNVNYHVFKSPAPFSAPSAFDATISCIILGGGGGSSYSSPSGNGGPGGGGAGALIDKSSVPLSGPFNLTVTVGPGGAKASAVNTTASDGGDSSVNFPGGTLTAEGGGAGGRAEVPKADGSPYPGGGPGRNGGSGGGAGLYYPKTGGTATGSPFPGTPGDSPDTGWGHAGGRGGDPGNPQNPFYYAGGGGGAGGAGSAGGDGTYGSGGTGGNGYLLPTNFQIPAPAMSPSPWGYPGPAGGAYWVAGGGASGMYYHPPDTPKTATEAAARGGGASHGPGAAGFAGAGNGVVSSTSGVHYGDHTDALDNSGSGGGGGGGSGSSGGPGDGGNGGSGLVLISYSYDS